jgi:hypothetical protein
MYDAGVMDARHILRITEIFHSAPFNPGSKEVP